MKKLNKKGFTLIELLAVIVILAILVAVAVPAVTRYLNTARKGTYADNAQSAISAVRNDVISNFGAAGNRTYYLNSGNCILTDGTSSKDYTKTSCNEVNGVWVDSINDLLEKKLKNSPYGKAYSDDSYIKVNYIINDGSYEYVICLTDGTNTISGEESTISENTISNGSCNATT